jgi:hypothetical protein
MLGSSPSMLLQRMWNIIAAVQDDWKRLPFEFVMVVFL